MTKLPLLLPAVIDEFNVAELRSIARQCGLAEGFNAAELRRDILNYYKDQNADQQS
jgi:hypothetical protein